MSAALHQVKKKLFLFCVTLECSETFEDLTDSNLNLINRKSKDRKSITASKGLKNTISNPDLPVLLPCCSHFVDFLVLLCVSSHLQGGC